MAGQDRWERFYGPNAGYVLELYERYQADPTSVDEATRAFFEQSPALDVALNGTDTVAVAAPVAVATPATNGATAMQAAPPPVPMIGHVTSSYFSPTLGRSIAMAVVRSGQQRMGQKIYAALADGRYVAATVCSPVFYDPEGKRLHA